MDRIRRITGIAIPAALILWTTSQPASYPALSRFEKLSDHFYYSRSSDDAGNLGILVTDEGVLLIDTPAPKDVPSVLEMLRKLTPSPVAWVVNTHFHKDHTGGNGYFVEHQVPVISSKDALRLMLPGGKEREASTHGAGDRDLPASAPRFAFARQIHLYPAGIEVRVMAVEHGAHTSGDVVVLVPSEKILHAGDLYSPDSFPAIDTADGEGSPLGWIDAMRKVIEAVPLVKSAMPQPKPDPSKPPAEEKTLEEQFIVVPGHGPASNLKEMKVMLEAAQKVRTEAGRAVSAGRSLENFLASPALAPYRVHKNLATYASQLYDALSHK